MPGTSIDAPVAELPTMTSYAVSLLIDFHIQTKQEVMLDGVNFGMLVSSPLGRVVTGLGSSAEASAARIEKLAHNILYGKPFMLVWMHGDYKIENLIFDPDSLQVTGIIDWDLSQAKGYPLLDLLYLITYNRVITEHREIEEVILNCIVPQRFSEFEREISDSYVRELGLDADAMEVLIMLFCIHHIAYRREISGCDAKTVENLRIMLGAVEGLLENKYRITSLK
jgi:aminoglycoside phosphotransferase (APT) family kinase protein